MITLQVPIPQPVAVNRYGLRILAVKKCDNLYDEQLNRLLFSTLKRNDYFQVVKWDSTNNIEDAIICAELLECVITDTIDQAEQIRRCVKLIVNFRLLDIEYNLFDEQTHHSEYCSHPFSDEDKNLLPELEDIKQALLSKTIQHWIKSITPIVILEKRIIETSDDELAKRGVEKAKQGKWVEAKKIWLEAIKLNPDDASIWYNLGLAYEIECNLEEAINAYKKAYSLKKSHRYYNALKRIQ